MSNVVDTRQNRIQIGWLERPPRFSNSCLDWSVEVTGWDLPLYCQYTFFTCLKKITKISKTWLISCIIWHFS